MDEAVEMEEPMEELAEVRISNKNAVQLAACAFFALAAPPASAARVCECLW